MWDKWWIVPIFVDRAFAPRLTSIFFSWVKHMVYWKRLLIIDLFFTSFQVYNDIMAFPGPLCEAADIKLTNLNLNGETKPSDQWNSYWTVSVLKDIMLCTSSVYWRHSRKLHHNFKVNIHYITTSKLTFTTSQLQS